MTLLETRGLKKIYRPSLTTAIMNRDRKRTPIKAVDGISFKVNKGDVFGLLGPNGAGKSTTMKMLMGIIRPNGGKILLHGESIYKNYPAPKINIGYMPEALALPKKMRVINYLKYSAGYYMPRNEVKDRVKEVMEELNIWDKRNMKIEELSQGYKRRVLFAQAVVHSPDLLILDEPTNGLDPEAIVEFRDIIRTLNRKGMTIIIASHILDEVQRVTNTIGIIHRGKMVLVGETEDILRKMKDASTTSVIINGRNLTADVVRTIMKEKKIDCKASKCAAGVCLIDINEEELEKLLIGVYDRGIVPTTVMQEEPTLEDIYMGVINDKLKL